MMIFLGAVTLAATLDTAHAALARAIDGDPDYGACSAAQRQPAAAEADIRTLGQINGRNVVLAGVHASCVCGNVNCPWHVLRLDPGKPRVLFSTYAFQMDAIGTEKPLPKLRAQAHDSALVTDEATVAYQDGRYVTIETARVRGDTGARKPNDVPVRFAYGASSARLKGSVSLGWYDEYALAAAKGQRLMIDGIASQKKLSLTLFVPNSAQVVDVAPGVPVTLGSSGTFRLHVENGSEAGAPYALTLTIRN